MSWLFATIRGKLVSNFLLPVISFSGLSNIIIHLFNDVNCPRPISSLLSILVGLIVAYFILKLQKDDDAVSQALRGGEN